MSGSEITFDEFAIGTSKGFIGVGADGAAELAGPLKKMLAYAQSQGAGKITLTGRYASPEGSKLGTGSFDNGGKWGQTTILLTEHQTWSDPNFLPANSLLQGGKDGWFKMIGPDAGKSQQFLLNKKGGEHLPAIKNIEILDKK
ncbi:hypothetical protein AZH11_27125 [Pseudomonas simiae]|nr:hypothetical protein AZH11_27125 [Pseudomonas simiae]